MARTLIADFEPGRPIEGVFAVLKKQRRHNRNGDPFLVMELSDSSGRIEAKVWDNAEHFDRTIRVGDTVLAVGKPSVYRDELQLDVRRLEPAAGDGAALVPAANRPLGELVGELEFLIDEIQHPQLAALVRGVWNGPDRERLERAPATPADHHSYLGGLVEHTVGVAAIASAALERHNGIDRDLVLAACLLHDVGRAREIDVDQAFIVPEAGQLYGHVLLGHEMVMAAAARVGVDPESCAFWPALVHAMQQHHSSPDRCRTREAMVVAAANALDARLAMR